MKLATIAFTKHGAQLCRNLQQGMTEKGHICEAFSLGKYCETAGVQPVRNGLSEWTKEMFRSCDGLIFIGACGIAVRAIAPYVEDKTRDPAVIAVDEQGCFVIPLLSGHIGGANELALEISALVGGTSVVTTATDRNHKFAVDSWAVKQEMHISSMKAAKEVSAALVNGDPVGLISEFEVAGRLPNGIVQMCKKRPDPSSEEKRPGVGILVVLDELKQELPFEETLILIPKVITIGVGCRKGASVQQLDELVSRLLEENHISHHAVKNICSIDIKAEEQGILELCQRYGVGFQVFTAEELLTADGSFEPSDFVKGTVGVDNVCERAAALGSGNGKILIKKQKGNGVTAAIAVEDWRIQFE